MKPKLFLLDNPIWNALSSVHQEFAVGTPGVKCYQEQTIPFMGIQYNDKNLLTELEAYLKEGEERFLKDELESVPENWEILQRLACIQMVYNPSAVESEINPISQLSEQDSDELNALVNLVQPGFFKRKTTLLGNYYGIRKEGILVAVAGERMKLDGFTELSAVCTHPSHTGNGYAQQLLRGLCQITLEKGNIPFLHVLESNKRAIQIYEFLNFTKRIDFPLVKLKYTGKN